MAVSSKQINFLFEWVGWRLLIIALRRDDPVERAGSVTPSIPAALDYFDFVWGKPWDPALVLPAAEKGDTVLRATGTVEAAAEALNNARPERFGSHHDDLHDPIFAECLEADHYKYLLEMATRGVPSRRRQPREPLNAKPHSSASDHMLEVFEKAWADTAYGSDLLATPASEPLLGDLVESPNGWVPKQRPDRTSAADGRIILDMRIPNAAGHKTDHPPALQPRHAQLYSPEEPLVVREAPSR